MMSVRNLAAQSAARLSSGSFRRVSWRSELAALVVLDLAGRIRYLNQAAREIFGVSLEQVRGSNWTNCINVVDRATRAPIAYPLKSIANSNMPARMAFNAVLVSMSGPEVPVEVHVEPFPDPDNAVSVSGAVMTFYGSSESAPQQ